MITLLRVDFPEPFGPIKAWISPCRTVRSIPRRISLPSTVARSPRTSRVAGASPFLALIASHLDQDVVPIHRDGVAGHRLHRRQAPRPAGRDVEGRAVLGTFDRPRVE